MSAPGDPRIATEPGMMPYHLAAAWKKLADHPFLFHLSGKHFIVFLFDRQGIVQPFPKSGRNIYSAHMDFLQWAEGKNIRSLFKIRIPEDLDAVCYSLEDAYRVTEGLETGYVQQGFWVPLGRSFESRNRFEHNFYEYSYRSIVPFSRLQGFNINGHYYLGLVTLIDYCRDHGDQSQEKISLLVDNRDRIIGYSRGFGALMRDIPIRLGAPVRDYLEVDSIRPDRLDQAKDLTAEPAVAFPGNLEGKLSSTHPLDPAGRALQCGDSAAFSLVRFDTALDLAGGQWRIELEAEMTSLEPPFLVINAVRPVPGAFPDTKALMLIPLPVMRPPCTSFVIKKNGRRLAYFSYDGEELRPGCRIRYAVIAANGRFIFYINGRSVAHVVNRDPILLSRRAALSAGWRAGSSGRILSLTAGRISLPDGLLDRFLPVTFPRSAPGHRFLISTHCLCDTYDCAAMTGPLSQWRLEDMSVHDRLAAASESLERRTREMSEKVELDRRKAQKEKLESLGLLAGGVAHDFNNQLAAIMAWAEMIQKSGGPAREVRELAGHIIRVVERSAGLTENLMNFAARDVSTDGLFDLHETLRHLLCLAERTLDRRFRLEPRFGARPSRVRGNESQIENAILNLLLNAGDADPKSGVIIVATDNAAVGPDGSPAGLAPGDYVRVSVIDDGVGMDEETARRVFEPFFTTKPRGKGTGLGLSSVYGIARRNGGAIDFTTRPGEGSRFDLYLPRAPREKASARDRIRDRTRTRLRSAAGRICVIEDEEPVMVSLTGGLELAGYRVRAIRDSRKALSMAAKAWNGIDAVVLDLVMPGADGREVFEHVRSVSPAMKIVLMSGYDREHEAGRLLERGASAFLKKPFRIERLLDCLDSILPR